MHHFIITLAGVPMEIHSLFPSTKKFCQNYLSNESPLFSITVTWEDIDYERKKAEQQNLIVGHPSRTFKDSYLETLAVYRKIANQLLNYDIILFHGAVITMEDQAYLFTAPSGTGKTTHIFLWKQLFRDSVSILNGDKPLLKITPGGIFACGTPWQGKENEGKNDIAPLKAICVLKRGQINQISSLTYHEALPALFQQTYRPDETESVVKTMELIGKLQNVNFYSLSCNMDLEAAQVAYEGMQ